MKDFPFVTEFVRFGHDDGRGDDDYNDEYNDVTPSSTQQTCSVAPCPFQQR